MASDRQIAANRENAKRSTGPRSEAGKARSARNALKHGLSAEQVVMLGEDPAAFEALRSDLIEHYQPVDPVAEHLVDQVAACIWRLKRVPEIEAGIFSYHYHLRERDLARARANAEEYDLFPPTAPLILDEEAHAEAKNDQERAEVELDRHQPVMGEVFGKGERSLNSLIRIASVIEGSLYRAIRELERMKARRDEVKIDHTVFDFESKDAPPFEPSEPRLIES